MPVNFKIKDFFYPLSILKLNRFLDKSQWFSLRELEQYQFSQLQKIITHAYENVEYYTNLFHENNLTPIDFKCLDDLKKIPLLNKSILKKSFNSLIAKNAGKYHPKLYTTSGSTGEPVKFYLDKPSNVLEFCYYYRYWKWAGYKIGDKFVELANDFFVNHEKFSGNLYHYNKLTRSLKMNTNLLSEDTALEFAECIRKFKPDFLFGVSSGIYCLALLFQQCGIDNIRFKAVFSHADMMLDSYRELIEEIFKCNVFDSYGHMERTVSICQCDKGKYHFNSEYGIMEILDAEPNADGTGVIGKVVGTSLHNFAMPFLRYEIGDYIEVPLSHQPCECGRNLPVIKKIHGRQDDAVITPSGKIVTELFTLFDEIQGVDLGQVIQETKTRIHLKIAKNAFFTDKSEQEILALLNKIIGTDMDITKEYVTVESLRSKYPRKFKVVVSKLKNQDNILNR